MKIQSKNRKANEFQSIKAGEISQRKKLGMHKKPRAIKGPGARAGLKKGAGG